MVHEVLLARAIDEIEGAALRPLRELSDNLETRRVAQRRHDAVDRDVIALGVPELALDWRLGRFVSHKKSSDCGLTVKQLLYYCWYNMYFTIQRPPTSSPALSGEALGALGRLSQQATSLEGLSASFGSEARTTVDAYAIALSDGSPRAWTSFVSAAASLATHAEAVDEIVHLNRREREAVAFFEQIVRENDDLLERDAVVAA
ncbi:MAG: hypothetical protein ACRENA_08625 [Vulcanimicrobiaceae bacterium]